MVELRQQLCIHSGAFKTATSAVQTILNKNAEVLLRDYSILVPRALSRPLQGVAEEGARSHNLLGHLVRSFRRGEADAEEKLRSSLAMLAGEIRASGSPKAVISTEMLTGIDKRSAAVVRDCLEEFDLQVVYSVRRVDEYFESLARQELKFRNAIQKLEPPYETPFTGLLAWAEVLGDGAAIDVLVYGHPSRKTAVFNTLRAIGIQDPAALIGDNPERNPSLHSDGLLLRRALARFAAEIGHDATNNALREAIVQRAYRWEAELGTLKPLFVYSKAERLAIFDATLPVHEEIARRFLTREQSSIFLSRAAIEALDEHRPVHWDQSEVLSIVDEVANFALEQRSVIAPNGHVANRLRKQVRRVRRRNTQLRNRIKVLEAQVSAASEPSLVRIDVAANNLSNFGAESTPSGWICTVTSPGQVHTTMSGLELAAQVEAGSRYFLFNGRAQPSFDKPPPAEGAWTTTPGVTYELSVRLCRRSQGTPLQMWVFEYDENARVAQHKIRMSEGENRLRFTADDHSARCRIVFRISGSGHALLEDLTTYEVRKRACLV